MQDSYPVAKPENPANLVSMSLRCLILVPVLALSLGICSPVSAEGPPPPPPPKPEEGNRPPWQRGGPNGPGGQGGMGGHGFGFGGPMNNRDRGQGMENLSETEKKRLREAVEKVWSNPEVAAAREKIMKANEELRAALREAVKKNDPEVVAIMEKVKTQFPWDQRRGPPPLPRSDDPDFPNQAIARLGLEMMTFAKPEQREAMRHLHERVLELPGVKDAVSKLRMASNEGRPEAFKALRDVYKHECEKAIEEFRRRRAAGDNGGGNLSAPKR